MTQNQLICLNDGQATRQNSNSIIDLAGNYLQIVGTYVLNFGHHLIVHLKIDLLLFVSIILNHICECSSWKIIRGLYDSKSVNLFE
jgi:hypothetical protein